MEKEEILRIGREIEKDWNPDIGIGFLAQVKELIKSTYGKNNSFYEEANKIQPDWLKSAAFQQTSGILKGFLYAVEKDIINKSSLQSKIKNEIIHDYLAQAENIIDNKSMHPAAAAMIIGASLEEFLRTWAKDENLVFDENTSTINSFITLLRENDYIDKQEQKELTAWAGIRNDASHGKWEKCAVREKVQLYLEQVNLFIKTKTLSNSKNA